MIILEQIIAHLNGYEKNDFLSYVQRQDAPKVIQLAKMLLSETPPSSQEMKAAIYGEDDDKNFKRDAFNALRKELADDLIEWVILGRIDVEHAPASRILSLIIVAQFMLERNAVESARQLLFKAEEIAQQRRRYEVLETIYSWLIDYAAPMGIDAEEIITKWELNTIKYDKISKMRKTIAKQKAQNKKAKQTGKSLNPDIRIKKTKKDMKITVDDANDPLFMMLLAKLFRTAIVTGKDYSKFENYISKVYHRLKNHGQFLKGDKEYELEILYMYAHACYRNRKFRKAEELCHQMEELYGAKNIKLHPVFPQYTGLRAGIAAYTNRLKEAINTIECAIENNANHSEITEWINMKLNLAVYRFHSQDYRKANRVLHSFGSSDSELTNLMGMEWCFKKKMIEMIVQYELGNPELSYKMVHRLRNEYANMLSDDMYQRADIFLNFILDLLNDPDQVTTPEFKEKVKNSKIAWPGYKEDVHALSFFVWLRSKMENRPYYELLMESMGIDLNDERLLY